mmetsp:Transcript_119956/g.344781  ORF Transcript_119956/g.344781 Transcript_119956/m.344781 type:complete len:240 (-) Transcript_119956:707-1426(-)
MGAFAHGSRRGQRPMRRLAAVLQGGVEQLAKALGSQPARQGHEDVIGHAIGVFRIDALLCDAPPRRAQERLHLPCALRPGERGTVLEPLPQRAAPVVGRRRILGVGGDRIVTNDAQHVEVELVILPELVALEEALRLQLLSGTGRRREGDHERPFPSVFRQERLPLCRHEGPTAQPGCVVIIAVVIAAREDDEVHGPGVCAALQGRTFRARELPTLVERRTCAKGEAAAAVLVVLPSKN